MGTGAYTRARAPQPRRRVQRVSERRLLLSGHQNAPATVRAASANLGRVVQVMADPDRFFPSDLAGGDGAVPDDVRQTYQEFSAVAELSPQLQRSPPKLPPAPPSAPRASAPPTPPKLGSKTTLL